MLSSIVGDVTVYSAAVLVAMFICVGIFSTTWIANRRSKRELEMKHELAKMAQNDLTRLEHERISSNHNIKTKQIEQGLITSHSRQGGGDGEG